MDKRLVGGVGRAVRTSRAWAGLTMAQLAALVGVSWQTVSAWEGGKQEPSIARAGKVAEACGLQYSVFWRWSKGDL